MVPTAGTLQAVAPGGTIDLLVPVLPQLTEVKPVKQKVVKASKPIAPKPVKKETSVNVQSEPQHKQ